MFKSPVRLLAFALLGACIVSPALAKTHTHAKTSGTSKAPTLIWRGDVATGEGFVNDTAAAWQRTGQGRIELQPFNTASGIDAVSSGAADLAGSARGSDDSAENANLTFTPIAWDALVIVTNAGNPVRSLSIKQVHDIYYGRITQWSQLGGNNAPIDVYAVASPHDGVEFSLRQLLFGRGDQPVAAPRLYVNTHKLEEGVELNPNGLGAASLADIRGNGKLQAVAIEGVRPSPASIADGSYPLYAPLYLVTNPRNPHAAQVQDFLQFLHSDAARDTMRANGVLPYEEGPALARADDARRRRVLASAGLMPNAIENAIRSGTAGERADASLASVNTLAAAQLRTATGHDGTATHNTATYQVVAGDTLASIADNHSLEVAQLRRWNHLSSDHVTPGQWLRLSEN